MTQEQINALLKKKAGTTEVIKEEKVMVAAEEVKETINEDVIKEETSMMAE